MDKWQLMVTDITKDDEGCARFQVNSAIPFHDEEATSAAACLLNTASDLLAACERAEVEINEGRTMGGALRTLAIIRAAIAKARGQTGGVA